MDTSGQQTSPWIEVIYGAHDSKRAVTCVEAGCNAFTIALRVIRGESQLRQNLVMRTMELAAEKDCAGKTHPLIREDTIKSPHCKDDFKVNGKEKLITGPRG
jgi:hypothetical protein